MPRITPWQLRYLTEVDQRDHVAWAVFAREPAGWAGVAVGRWVRLADEPDAAEFALTVVDDWQGHGVATHAILAVTPYAFAALDACRVFADIDPGNVRCSRAFRRAGYRFEVLPREAVPPVLADLEKVSRSWLRGRPTGSRTAVWVSELPIGVIAAPKDRKLNQSRST